MVVPVVSATPAVRRIYRPPGEIVIAIDDVTKLYHMGSETVHALRGIALTIRRNEYLANIKHYVSFLHLTRTSRRGEAGRKLLEAIRLHPRIVARRKTFTLLCAWLLLALLPRSLAPTVMTTLLRVHGRLMALIVPELRRSPIVARR